MSLTLTSIRQSLHKHDSTKYVLRSSTHRRGAPGGINVIVYTRSIGKLIDRKCEMFFLFLSRPLCLNPHKRKRKFRYGFLSLHRWKLIWVWKEPKEHNITAHSSTSATNKAPPDDQIISCPGLDTDESRMGVSGAETYTPVSTISPATSNDRVRRTIYIQRLLIYQIS